MNLINRIKSALTPKTSRAGVFATFLNLFYPLTAIDPKKYYTSWVFAAINTIAEQTSTLEIKLQTLKGDEWEDVDQHESLTLLKRVNPEMTSSQLFYSVAAWCEAEGNAFWYVVRNGKNEPVELWPLDSTKMKIKTDENGYISGYALTNETGTDVPFKKEEILHFKRFNILDRLRGIGTIEAIGLEADTDRNAASYNRNFFYNSGMPAASLETDKELTDEQVARIRDQWNSKYSGPENAGKTALLHSGIKFKPTSMSQKDMQYLEGRKYSRDSIIAIFRVPPVMLGILENANRANIEGAEYIFAKYRIKPYQEFIVDHLNEFYLPMWNLSQDTYRYVLAKDPVPANEELELKKKVASYGKWLTANEIRALEGLDDVEGGDELASPGGSFSDQLPEETPVKSKKKIFTKARRDPVVVGSERVIDNNISKSEKKYKKILDTTKDDLLAKLKKQKSFKPHKIPKGKNLISNMDNYIKAMLVRKDKADDLASLLFEDWDKYISILFDSIKDDYEISMSYGGKVALQRVDVGIKFDITNDRAQAWIADQGLKNATSIIGTLKDDLRAVILDAAKEGQGAQGVADALSTAYSELEDWKALQIARTELSNGYGQGTLEGYRQSDVVEKKKWLTAGAQDEVCTGNEDAGAIPLDDDFPSGDDAPAAHVNCRCSLLPVVSND